MKKKYEKRKDIREERHQNLGTHTEDDSFRAGLY